MELSEVDISTLSIMYILILQNTELAAYEVQDTTRAYWILCAVSFCS
jgi:hypothetical protein